MSRKTTYDAGSIAVLEGLEAVRVRPGMYIGSVSTKGLNHLVYEIVDNAVDEHLAGFCTEIHVTLEKDGSATVSDNGRGVPVDPQHVWSIRHFMQGENLMIQHIRPVEDFMESDLQS